MLLDVRPGRLWSGEFFRGWSLSKQDVSSELLNMLIHVTPGRWWRVNFPGRELVRKGGKKFGKGSSSVISELVNMLSHFSPERW